MFGEKLYGNAAVASKNVFKELVDNHKTVSFNVIYLWTLNTLILWPRSCLRFVLFCIP